MGILYINTKLSGLTEPSIERMGILHTRNLVIGIG